MGSTFRPVDFLPGECSAVRVENRIRWLAGYQESTLPQVVFGEVRKPSRRLAHMVLWDELKHFFPGLYLHVEGLFYIVH